MATVRSTLSLSRVSAALTVSALCATPSPPQNIFGCVVKFPSCTSSSLTDLLLPPSHLSLPPSALFISLMLAYWADYGLRNDQSDAQWRLRELSFPSTSLPHPFRASPRPSTLADPSRTAALALQVAFALITVTLVVFLPESPRWLVAHGDIPGARDVLFRLDGTRDAKARTTSVDLQLGEIVAAVELERREAAGWGTCFTMGEQRFFHRVLLGAGSQFMQQISGINLISYYARASPSFLPSLSLRTSLCGVSLDSTSRH